MSSRGGPPAPGTGDAEILWPVLARRPRQNTDRSCASFERVARYIRLVELVPFGFAQGVFGVSHLAALNRVRPRLVEDPDEFQSCLFEDPREAWLTAMVWAITRWVPCRLAEPEA
jgi:hypothetical protein